VIAGQTMNSNPEWVDDSSCEIPEPMPIMAGPFSETDFEQLVPADKKLSKAWIRSLTERGAPEWLSGEDLNYIGMPVGGICCGQVYLSGDGRLWHWDIFNAGLFTRPSGPHYARPMTPDEGIGLEFKLRARSGGKETIRSLDREGFPDVRFRGAYPMGFVEYADDACPVSVSLEAFSPFCPLEVDDSSLPLTVMRYTVRNTSSEDAEVSLAGQLPNPVLKNSGNDGKLEFVNTVWRRKGVTSINYSVDRKRIGGPAADRPNVVLEDFESGTFDNWTVEGTAFGMKPDLKAGLPRFQRNMLAKGEYVAQSHNARNGESRKEGNAYKGVMTSKPFTIQRDYIHALVCGSRDAKKSGLQLLIDGEVVVKRTGQNNGKMRRVSFDVAAYAGREAQLRIVDQAEGDWGHIAVDQIVFSDYSSKPAVPLEQRSDMGDMTLAVLDHGDGIYASAGTGESLFVAGAESARDADGRPVGSVGKAVSLQAGEETTISFVVGWHFPNHKTEYDVGTGHYYAKRFGSSQEAVDHLTDRYEELYARTRLWHETWYDSTLPHWLLDRSFANTSTLATSTSLRFEDGRFWGWEGVGCCPGTCTHVWHYAQSVGRVFPELERITRENVDYGVALQPDVVNVERSCAFTANIRCLRTRNFSVGFGRGSNIQLNI